MARSRSHTLGPRQTAAAIKSQRWAWGRGSLPPQGLGLASGWLWWGLWSSAGQGQFPGPPVICWSDAHELESPEEKAKILLLPHSLPDDCHSTADRWLKWREHQWSVPDSCSLGQLTNVQHWPMAEWPLVVLQQPLPGTGAEQEPHAKGCTWQHSVT